MNKVPKILIIVHGGNVQSVISNSEVQVCIKDFDNIKDCGDKFDGEFSSPDEIIENEKDFQEEVMADI